MCGIAGVLDLTGETAGNVLTAVARRMADALVHRGPDDSGVWLSPDGRCALSHRRLSIIDVSAAGHQPMVAPGGREALSYNGELYDFAARRPELAAAGWHFRTRTDSEVMLAGLALEGDGFLSRIDAMYALAHYDSDRGELLLARDPFGEKPLVWWTDGRLFAFASEMGALAVVPGFRPRIDRTRIFAYLSLQYIPSPATIYTDVARLLPGTAMRVRTADGRREARRHFAFDTSAGDDRPFEESDLEPLADELEAILTEAVRTRLVSDVPLGAFLSGGIDSSTVVALACRRLGREIETFSLGFAGAASSEHEEARAIAVHLGTRHRDRVIDVDLLSMLARVAADLDEPNGDTSCLPTHLLSALAREHVTVALSGDGGDELFGGYGRYFSALADAETVARGGTPWPGWTRGVGYWNSRILVFGDGTLADAAGSLPDRLAALLGGWRRDFEASPRPFLSLMREADAARYMPGAVLAKVDRMGMRHGLEVRAPLLGRAVAGFAARLPRAACVRDGIGKRVLRRVAVRHLPEAWMNRPKMGFGLPIADWGTATLRARARDVFARNDCRLAAFVDIDRLQSFVATRAGTYQLWSLLVLEEWMRTHPAEPVEAPAMDPYFPAASVTATA